MNADDPQAMRKLVPEVEPGGFQGRREAWAGKALRIAAQAEGERVDDIVAAALATRLGKERHDAARLGVDDARTVVFELVVDASGLRIAGNALAGLGRSGILGKAGRRGEHGDRDTGRHQPARTAPGV